MPQYLVVPATQEHAHTLAPLLRPADVEELDDVGHAPLEALKLSVASSRHAFAAFVDGEIVCLFGVSPRSLVSDEGFPWLLASAKMVRHARAIMSISSGFVARMKDDFKFLHNWVSPRNIVAIRWLRWLGFAVADQPTPYGPKGTLMLHFEMRR